MKKLIIICLAILFLFTAQIASAGAEVNLYFFYGDGCPHCAKEEKFLDKLEKEIDSINILRYEVWHNKENSDMLKKIADQLDLEVKGAPLLIVGEETVSGYYNDKVTGEKIRSIVENYLANGCEDIVAPIIGLKSTAGECIHGCDVNDAECMHECGCESDAHEEEIPESISIPLLGEVKTADFSLPILTIIIGAIDGFNPCAMWTLLFLISLLLGMKDKKRMWILGSAFVAGSGLVYFLFLSAWLNIFLFLGFVFWVRVAIGVVALVSGGLHLRSAWRNREGCIVEESEKRKLVFKKLREIAGQQSFWLALGGIVLLAFAVNLVELVCSAGLPAVYTQVLALSSVPAWHYYGYLVLYIFVFMLDDLLVFFIAMTTLQMKAFSSRYTKYSGFIGGALMIIIGLLLLFKPGWLMFG